MLPERKITTREAKPNHRAQETKRSIKLMQDSTHSTQNVSLKSTFSFLKVKLQLTVSGKARQK